MNRDAIPKLRSDGGTTASLRDAWQLAPTTGNFAMLTCMDARIDPASFVELRGSDAHVVRNAGGRASEDAIRSLVMAYRILGAREWFIVQHSQCGMALLSDELSRELLAGTLATTVADGHARRSDATLSQTSRVIDWPAIQDRQSILRADLQRIRQHPLVPAGVALRGYLHQVETGRLVEVVAADGA
jgi:carbonic anhydrase